MPVGKERAERETEISWINWNLWWSTKRRIALLFGSRTESRFITDGENDPRRSPSSSLKRRKSGMERSSKYLFGWRRGGLPSGTSLSRLEQKMIHRRVGDAYSMIPTLDMHHQLNFFFFFISSFEPFVLTYARTGLCFIPEAYIISQSLSVSFLVIVFPPNDAFIQAYVRTFHEGQIPLSEGHISVLASTDDDQHADLPFCLGTGEVVNMDVSYMYRIRITHQVAPTKMYHRKTKSQNQPRTSK
jgi:hypothetical protein